MSNKSTKDVVSILERIEKEKEDILSQRIARPAWKTTCRLSIPGIDPFSIQIAREASVLVFCLGQLERFAEDCRRHGVDPIWEGYPALHWIEDIKIRLKQIEGIRRMDELTELEGKVKPLMTKDEERERVLSSLSSQIEDLFVSSESEVTE